MFLILVRVVNYGGKPLCAHSASVSFSDICSPQTPGDQVTFLKLPNQMTAVFYTMCFSFQNVVLNIFQLLSTNVVGYGLPRNAVFSPFFLTFQMPAFGVCVILWFPTHLLHPLITPPALSLPHLPRLSPPFPNIPGSPQGPS